MSEFSEGLRALADWFDQHPDLPGDAHGGVTIFVGADHLPMVARAIGNADKRADQYCFELERQFADNLTLRTFTARSDVCEQVKVGERTVTRLVPPKGVELVEVTETEPVYEWRCPDSILRPQGEPGGDAIPTDDELDAMAEAAL